MNKTVLDGLKLKYNGEFMQMATSTLIVCAAV